VLPVPLPDWSPVTTERPPRCRPLPPHVVDAVRDTAPTVSEAELVDRLERALAALPAPERTAVIAAVGYDEGAVGAAMEAELSPEEAHALAQNGLQLLRAALGEDLP
jgi:DNA-directed RNA polymerase specialized sigma24 family protein